MTKQRISLKAEWDPNAQRDDPPPIAPGKPGLFLSDRWWLRTDAGGPYRALQYELGTRVVAALKRENRVWPPTSST